MKQNLKILTFACLAALSSLPAKSQLSLSGEYRPRIEFRQGYKSPVADSLRGAVETFQRTRISVDYKSRDIKTRFTFQDSRVWGQSPTNSSSPTVLIYEAWAEIPVGSVASVTVGRQALKYDDQRIFGNANWNNTGNAHDLALIKLKASRLNVNGGFAFNNASDISYETDYSTASTGLYKTMGFVWLGSELKKGLSYSFIGVTEGLQKPVKYKVVYPRYTFGGNFVLSGDSTRFGGNIIAYYQTGKSSSFINLNSYFLALIAKCKLTSAFTVKAGAEFYSGTPASKTDKWSTFEKLYGANHALNGYMDYWTKIPKQGLTDLYLGVLSKFSKKCSVEAAFHSFAFPEDFKAGTKTYNKGSAGTELDLVCNYNVNKTVSIQGGYCFYFTSNLYEDYKKLQSIEVHQPQWAYLMLTIKPEIFKSSN